MYPPIITTTAQDIVNEISDDFFQENGINDLETGKNIAFKWISDYLFKECFLKGEELAFKTEKDLLDVLNLVVIDCLIDGLKKKGYINSYEDETTPEVIFLTEKGKKYAESRSWERPELYPTSGSLA